jgi:hypothetical protein
MTELGKWWHQFWLKYHNICRKHIPHPQLDDWEYHHFDRRDKHLLILRELDTGMTLDERIRKEAIERYGIEIEKSLDGRWKVAECS